MKKIFNLNRFLIAGVLVILVSCQKMKYDQQFASTYPISGEWTVKYEFPGVIAADTIVGPYLMYIYNTSFSKDSIWVDDLGYFFFPTLKAAANTTARTFTTSNFPGSVVLDGITHDLLFNITNGKVVKNDSIYMEVQLPGTIYKVYGHRKTSYEEYMGL